MATDRQIWLLTRLQGSLQKQIELARQAKIGEVETLALQTGDIADEIARTGILKLAEFAGKREKLAKLYRDLSLTLNDRKDEIRSQLNRIRRGKKTLGVYRSNL